MTDIIAVAASFTAEPLGRHLAAHLLGKKFTPEIVFGPFNQLRQASADYKAVFAREPDALIFLWRIEDIFPALLAACLDSAAALPKLMDEVKAFAADIARLRAAFKGTLVISTPPYPAMPGYELFETSGAGMPVFNTLYQLWIQEMLKIDGVRLFDLQAQLLDFGAKNAHDTRNWYLYRQPYAEEFWHDIGVTLGRIVAAEKRAPKKCVVLDLDNTLWGGIVGEDGIEGLQLGGEFPGTVFRDFQRYLMHLKSKGVLLAIASKNNSADVFEVFDKHDAMVLSRRDIVHFEIGWESKVDSVKRIAQKLNIGLDSIVFVDDSAKEIGEMRERMPDVSCVQVPDEIADLPALLAHTDYFDFVEITAEDRSRTELLVTEKMRQQAQEGMSEADFRKSLGLKITVFTAEKQHLARITQLVNKTNQFNLTTLRRTQSEIETLAGDKSVCVLGMDVKDKYGDYGLVGAGILKKQNAACIIDTLLMSCRVLGRGAEEALLAGISAAAKSLGCTELRGNYIPTPKNEMVKDLYSRFGFKADGSDWVLPL